MVKYAHSAFDERQRAAESAHAVFLTGIDRKICDGGI